MYTKDLDRIPDRQPEELNYASLIQQVAALKRYKHDNELVVSKLAADILNLQDTVLENQGLFRSINTNNVINDATNTTNDARNAINDATNVINDTNTTTDNEQRNDHTQTKSNDSINTEINNDKNDTHTVHNEDHSNVSNEIVQLDTTNEQPCNGHQLYGTYYC